MRKFGEAFYFVALCGWIGGLWVIGYVVAPVLFSSLSDRQLAGVVAGKLFALIGWIGLVCGLYLLGFLLARRGGRALATPTFWAVLIMLGLTAVSQFGIQPLMVQLKADALPKDVMESVLRDRFVTWHGISSILYLIQSLCGLGLVATAPRGLK